MFIGSRGKHAEHLRAFFLTGVSMWACACMCKQLASLPVVLGKQKRRYSGWGYEAGGADRGWWGCRHWMRHLVLTVKNILNRMGDAVAEQQPLPPPPPFPASNNTPHHKHTHTNTLQITPLILRAAALHELILIVRHECRTFISGAFLRAGCKKESVNLSSIRRVVLQLSLLQVQVSFSSQPVRLERHILTGGSACS